MITLILILLIYITIIGAMVDVFQFFKLGMLQCDYSNQSHPNSFFKKLSNQIQELIELKVSHSYKNVIKISIGFWSQWSICFQRFLEKVQDALAVFMAFRQVSDLSLAIVVMQTLIIHVIDLFSYVTMFSYFRLCVIP